MDDEERLAQVRALRAQGSTPKQVARILGLASSEGKRLVRELARQDAADAPAPSVVGCWVSAGWSEGLEAPADWPDSDVPNGIGHGIVSVLVAREHRRGRVSAAGYLVDVYCLGVKNAVPPRIMDDVDLRAFVRTYFSVYEAPALLVPLAMARELVLGAVAYARNLGFEPHADFEQAAGHLGPGEPEGLVRFGRDGKPYYVSGPWDDAPRIMRTLAGAVGEGNFHHLVAV